MTDLQKFKKLMSEFGIEFGETDTHLENFITIDTDACPDKILGHEWAACDFYFDDDEKFKYIDMSGD